MQNELLELHKQILSGLLIHIIHPMATIFGHFQKANNLNYIKVLGVDTFKKEISPFLGGVSFGRRTILKPYSHSLYLSNNFHMAFRKCQVSDDFY